MVPDLFIVGATKCATSTLHYQLSQCPDIVCSQPKEPRFLEDGLSMETARSRYERCWDSRLHFADFKVEANPNHLVIGYVPQKIQLINPKAKILIMIREPVARYISHVNYFCRMRPGRENMSSINDELDLDKFDYEENYVPYMCPEWGNYRRMYAETGCYSHYIPRFANLFDTRIVVFEDYVADPQKEIDEIISWLELSHYDLMDPECIRNKGNYTQTLDKYKSWELFYQPYNETLFTRLGRELWKY